MNKVTKKILSLVMAMTLVVGMIVTTNADTSKTISVTLTIERFTIGQGFLVEPVNVEVNEGASVKDALEKVAEEKGIKLNATTSSYGYYLDSISYADAGKVNIPQSISDMASIDVNYGYGPQHYDAPTNTSTNTLFEDEQKLGSSSYTALAGWMYGVNNAESSVTMESQPVKDGDVVRVQFSVYAGGADIGFTSWYENISSATLANKDALIKLVANTADSEQVKDAKAEAIKVLEKYDATQEEVDAAYSTLEKAQPTTDATTGDEVSSDTTAVDATTGDEASSDTTAADSTTTEATTVETTTTATVKETTTAQPTTVKATLKKASIKSLRNVKSKKVKVKINKVTGAKGYQIKYATNKKFKNSKIKNTKKLTYTIAKLKKKSRCYVKVRAYKYVGKKKVYGKWSNPKSVKIKK